MMSGGQKRRRDGQAQGEKQQQQKRKQPKPQSKDVLTLVVFTESFECGDK